MPAANLRARLIQREHEQVARVREIIVLDRVQVPAARLHGEKLLGPDRVGHRRALERRAEIETPQLLERLVVVGDDLAVLCRSEHDPAGGDERAGTVRGPPFELRAGQPASHLLATVKWV
jgi:hypothetical protein